MEPEFLPCPTCGEITLVEVPPCVDEHGMDCSDRACTRCGTGLSVAGHPSWDELAAAANAPGRRSRSAA